MLENLIKNISTFSISRPSIIINHKHIEKIKFLAALYQSSPLVFTTIDPNIKTIKDFKDKRIMTSDIQSTNLIKVMLKAKDVNFNDIILQQPSFNPIDLINKKTDIMSTYISNEPFILKEKGVNPIIFNPKDYGFDFYNDILTVSKEILESNPKMVQKFYQATLRGYKYAFNNIEELSKVILNEYNTQNKSLSALLYEGNSLKKLAHSDDISFGTIKKYKIESMYNMYKVLGFIDKQDNEEVKFDSLIYETTPRKVKKLLKYVEVQVGILKVKAL
jgi:polar amino acid transport system substrate-binding protein